MKSEICLKSISNDVHHPHSCEPSVSIFAQMKQVGINPDLFIEIAAYDLINQYGDEALRYSQEIVKNFTEHGDLQSAEIWVKLSRHLYRLGENDNLLVN